MWTSSSASPYTIKVVYILHFLQQAVASVTALYPPPLFAHVARHLSPAGNSKRRYHSKLCNTYYRWPPWHTLAHTIHVHSIRVRKSSSCHPRRTAPLVSRRRRPPPSSPGLLLRRERRERPCRWMYRNYQPSNTAYNNVILPRSDLVAIQLHQHSPVCSNLCLFRRTARPKNADCLQIPIYSNYPSPRSLFSSREQSVLTLSYKLAFCQRLRRY